MIFFNVSDFVGDDGINFVRFQKTDEGTGDKNITEFFDKAHHTGCNHASAEYGPVENVGIFHTCLSTHVFDPCSNIAGLKRFASPEFLDHQRAYHGNSNKENKKIEHLAFGGCQHLFRQLKWQDVDDVGNS